MYNEYEIRTIPLSAELWRKRIECFLRRNDLRLDDLDYYACVFRLGDEEEILAGGGLKGNTIKCIAVVDELREEGFSSRLISHLISEANARGHDSVKVFTKPENISIFEALGFSLIAKAPKAVLMEYGRELRNYCHYLSGKRRLGGSGIIVMNANPFTRGHRFLIEQASRQVDWLHIIVVREDLSEFSYQERKAMIEKGTEDFANVFVIEGSPYAVSSTTFPTYFLKEITDATDTQITLDLDLFVHFIAPHLGARIRFVGTEPTDSLTSRYNQLMREILPRHGYEVVEVPRLTCQTIKDSPLPVSASALRQYLHQGNFLKATELAYPSTIPFLFSYLACDALQQELDTTPKPGLIDKQDDGAHKDMNYKLMLLSIKALRPHFAKLCFRVAKPMLSPVKTIGLEAENDMFRSTGGINTHKGALFSLGITTAVASHLLQVHGRIGTEELRKGIAELASQFPVASRTHGSEMRKKHHIGGALDNASNGYALLFDDWLPFYRRYKDDKYLLHKTLLRIMSTLEDTNIYYRKGAEVALRVQKQAESLLADFSIQGLQSMNRQFIDENISPGGCADMLSLTIYIHNLTFCS
ncbi:MAG: [Prevotella sp.]|nr:[citrate (pro-3S)-lyase] ligase [Prevotella sp.]